MGRESQLVACIFRLPADAAQTLELSDVILEKHVRSPYGRYLTNVMEQWPSESQLVTKTLLIRNS